MAMGVCRECGKKVSSEAATCPSCGVPNPYKAASVGIFGWLAVGLVGITAFTMCSPSDRTPAPSRPKYDEFNASTECERFVKNSLKAPSTAEFAPHRQLQITGSGEGPWRVVGWVDAQNSFGAKLRNNFVCEVQFSGDTVRLLNLQIK